MRVHDWLCGTHTKSMINQTIPAVNDDTSDQTNQIPNLFSSAKYEEYGLPDGEYMKWLHENHAETVAICFIVSNNGLHKIYKIYCI